MSENYRTTRRSVLKATTAAGVAGLVGVSGSTGASQGGPIPMGSIMPITGELSAYGEGMQEAVNMAVQDVNDAGGPLDRQIDMTNTNSQTVPDQAIQEYQSLVNEENIVGFVGAASSGVSVPLAQQVADDGVMQVSHASTTPALADIGYGDDGETKYFARTSPNDAQQGIVMGQILNEGDYVGADSAAFLHVANPYGQGLAETASQAFDGETTDVVAYDPQATDYTSTLDQVFSGDPDAVGFVGYPGNGRTILEQWNNGGYGGEWVLSEGLNSAEFLQGLSDITSGMYVASPDPEQTEGGNTFEERMGEANTLFAAHAYDALFLMALAIEQAGEASGTAIAQNIRSVSRPDEGAMGTATETPGDEMGTETETAEETPSGSVVTVGEFDRAKELIADGEDINYQGASSPVNLNENLEPLNQFAILRVQEDGSTESLETIPRSFFRGQLGGGNGGQETTTE